MPISPDFTWQETDAGLQVKVDLKGVSRKRLDVFATEALIKVNAPPYLFSVDLAHDVDDSKSTATVDRAGVTFTLVKKVPGVWGVLRAEGEKQQLAKRREASIDAAHARANAARQAAVAKKKKDEKSMTDRQITLDNQKRRVIEQRKQDEMDSEAEGLKRWQASLHDPAANDSDTESEGGEEGEVQAAEDRIQAVQDHPEYHGRGWRQAEAAEGQLPAEDGRSRRAGAIDEEADSASDSESSASDGDSSDEEQAVAASRRMPQVIKPMPPPRRRMEPVEVEFTKLETDVLPAREHREVELKEYKKQQKEAAGLMDSMDVAERQPVFLKDKGDALYKQGNYRGAINAYSTAIQLDPHHLQCISNRAACWLKMGEASQCLADCEDALELLRPRAKRWEEGNSTEEDLRQFSKTFTRLLSRKAAAHSQLNELPEALTAYEEAVRYSPEDEALKMNIEELRAAMQPCDMTTLRQRADSRLRAGDHAGAAEAYGLLLSLPGVSPAERLAALSNRSAAFLVAGEFQASINDCNQGAVTLLEGMGVAGLQQIPTWVTESLLGGGADLAEEWSAGGGKRRSLQRLLARRGAAYSHLRLYREAARDLSISAAVCRSSGDGQQAAALEADAARVSALMGPTAGAEAPDGESEAAQVNGNEDLD